LVKSVVGGRDPAGGINGIGGIVEEVVKAVQGIVSLCIDSDEPHLRFNNALHLVESIGIMLGCCGGGSSNDGGNTGRHLTSFVTPLVSSLESAIISKNPEGCTTLVSLLAHLSKGYPIPKNKNTQSTQSTVSPLVVSAFGGALTTSITALGEFPLEGNLRQKTTFLLHRVLPLLPPDLALMILQPALDALLRGVEEVGDLQSVSQLINVVCVRYGGGASGVIAGVIGIFLSRCMEVMPKEGEGALLQYKVERTIVRKHYILVLQHVMSNGCEESLLGQNTTALLPNIFTLMIDTLLDETDPSIRKTCTTFFVGCVREFGPSNGKLRFADRELHDEFVNGFLYGRLCMSLMNTVVEPGVDVGDAMQARFLSEVGNLLYTVRQARGLDEFNRRFLSEVTGTAGGGGGGGISLNLNGVGVAESGREAGKVVRRFVEAYKKTVK